MQSTGVYRVGDQPEPPKRHRKRKWLIVTILIIAVLVGGLLWLKSQLKPHTVIRQSKAVSTKIDFNSQTKHYVEPDFSLDLPATWQPQPRPVGPYQSYTWTTSSKGTNGQQLVIYEDKIPGNFAVNRVLIVHSEGDHVASDGTASDNCAKYTIGGPTIGEFGSPAKWQGVSFICDQANQARDLIGTSSTDGLNTVILKKSDGTSHQFLFTLTNQNYASPDYSVLYNMLTSFLMN